jgi:hypothetical protein
MNERCPPSQLTGIARVLEIGSTVRVSDAVYGEVTGIYLDQFNRAAAVVVSLPTGQHMTLEIDELPDQCLDS